MTAPDSIDEGRTLDSGDAATAEVRGAKLNWNNVCFGDQLKYLYRTLCIDQLTFMLMIFMFPR